MRETHTDCSVRVARHSVYINQFGNPLRLPSAKCSASSRRRRGFGLRVVDSDMGSRIFPVHALLYLSSGGGQCRSHSWSMQLCSTSVAHLLAALVGKGSSVVFIIKIRILWRTSPWATETWHSVAHSILCATETWYSVAHVGYGAPQIGFRRATELVTRIHDFV
jgi:hypothetical protein